MVVDATFGGAKLVKLHDLLHLNIRYLQLLCLPTNPALPVLRPY